jgi:Protein of unknown function (DUF3040)
MRSQDSEQQILNAIETQLRSEDPRLAACFIAFASVTRNAGVPPNEQLTEGRRVASRRRHRRWGRPSHALLIQLVILFVAGLTMFFTVPAVITGMP